MCAAGGTWGCLNSSLVGTAWEAPHPGRGHGVVWGRQSRNAVRALLPVQEPCDCSSSGLMGEAGGAGQFHPTAHPWCAGLVVLTGEVIK